jgi:glutathione S-transferase
MSDLPRITTFKWVPPFARGFVRDLRARWAFEEVGQAYEVDLIDGPSAKSPQHRRYQPFGQVPTYSDGKVEIFESGAIALRIAEKGKGLLPDDADARLNAIQWLIAALNSVEPWVMQIAVVDVFEAEKPWSPMRRPRVIADLEGRLTDLEAALGDKTWLDGEAFTVGDLMMISVLGGLRGTDILQAYPRLAAYVARGEARPAHVKAMGDQLALYEAADAQEEMSA